MSSTHVNTAASLQACWPAGIVTDALLPNVTRVTVPSTTLPAYSCSARVVALKVTGTLPKTLDNRTRIVRPQRSGLTMERMVWSTAVAPVVFASGKGNERSGWIFATADFVGENPSA